MKIYDFVAIGDTVTDAFIQLKEASIHCNIDTDRCEICMRFADKIPYENVWVLPAVGNSANAAVSAARLGLKTALITDIGGDIYGEQAFQQIKKENISTEFINIHHKKKTNYHYVLWYEADRTILIKHEEYEYKLKDFGSPKWVYLSSLAENSLEFHSDLEKYLNEKKDIKFALQPGTFQMKFGKEKLAGLYKRADLFFCNTEEARRILKAEEQDVKKLMQMMHDLGPKIVVITDGPKGAYAFDGSEAWFMPAYPDPKPPYERTGAGDSFSSTVTAALALGKDISEALSWGPINSMSVVQYVGAQEGLLSQDKLLEYLAKAPGDYKPKKI